MAILQSQVRFQIQYRLETTGSYTLSFIDTVANDYNAVYGEVLANVLGIIRITDPNGTVLYQNTGYAADSFVSPDIDGGTPDWSETGITLNLDSTDGLPVDGTYTFDYKVSTDAGVSVLGGSAVTRTYSFAYVRAVIDLDVSSSCRTSTLTATDNTANSYRIAISGTNYDPNVGSVVRSMIVTPPVGSGLAGINAGNVSSYTKPANIWTGDWSVALTTTVNYTVSNSPWTDWVRIYDSLSAVEVHTVECDECTCEYNTCIAAIQTEWQSAIDEHGRYSEQDLFYRDRMLRIISYWMQKEQAERCGDDSDSYCDAIQTLVQQATPCTSTTTTTSQEVFPWTGAVTTTTSGSTIYTGTADPNVTPPTSTPIETDTYIRNTGAVWQYDGSTWVLQFTITGAAGTSGTDGVNILNNSIGTNTSDAGGVGEQTLGNYSLDTSSDYLQSNGEYVVVEAYFSVGAGIATTLRLRFNGVAGDAMAEYPINNVGASTIRLTTRLHRVSATAPNNLRYESKMENLKLSTETNTSAIANGSHTVGAAAYVIHATSQKTLAGGVGDVVLNYLIVRHYNLA